MDHGEGGGYRKCAGGRPVKAVNAVRAAAYTCGLAGLVLVVFARRTYPVPQGILLAGGVLLVAMVLLFMAAYVLYFFQARWRRGDG